MNQPSPDWLAEQAQAERQLVVRYDGLTQLLLRMDGYIRRAEESADVLARMPNGNPDARRQEAEDLTRCTKIVAHFAANLDRAHLLEEPSRRVSNLGQRRARR